MCHRRRSLKRWLTRRRLQSFLSTVANDMTNLTSARLRNRKLKEPLMTPEERLGVRARLRELLSDKKNKRGRRRCVVFFGDGQYGHVRGHAAVPKKSIIHELGVRTPTLLIDEYRTSKTCFCGRGLETAHGGKRVRVHTDNGDDCQAFQHGVTDRDELATLNIATAALSCLRGWAWPAHLCRPCG